MSVARIPCKPSTSRTITALMLGSDRLYKCDALLSSHFTVQYDTPAALARDAVVVPFELGEHLVGFHTPR